MKFELSTDAMGWVMGALMIIGLIVGVASGANYYHQYQGQIAIDAMELGYTQELVGTKYVWVKE